MSILNINELFINQLEKEKHKNEIYDDVLKKCHQKIQRSVSINPYNNYCFYIIPKFIYGIPLYNIEKCINYLIINLTKNGFKLSYTHPNLLLIWWIKPNKNDNSLKSANDLILKQNNIKSIDDYKPSGNLIYNSNHLKDLNKKSNILLN